MTSQPPNQESDDDEDAKGDSTEQPQDRQLVGGSASRSSCERCKTVSVELDNWQLWCQFHKVGTEMIVTKSGRRLFPALKVRIRGLLETKNYCVAVDVVPVDANRYRYEHSTWFVTTSSSSSTAAGDIDRRSPNFPQPVRRFYLHPDSPSTGLQWNHHPVISFHKLKLTNNKADQRGNIVVSSMRKYRPRIHVIPTDDVNVAKQALCGNSATKSMAGLMSFSFPETDFVAVTAYQNDVITQMKIDHNPFARGFQLGGGACYKRDASLVSTPRLRIDNDLQFSSRPVFTETSHKKAAVTTLTSGEEAWWVRDMDNL